MARLRADARAARDRNEPTAALRLLDEALGVWRGAPFVELEDLDWVLAVTERLRQDRLEMSEERWETVLALGRHTQITGELAAFVAEHGDRDRAVRHYALALHRSGRSPDALRAIADHRRELVESTGLDPSPALVELERAILDGDPSLDVDDPGVPLRGYRLLEEAGAGAFSVVWRAVQPSVGRDVAIKQIRAELASRPEFVRRFEAEAQLVARVEHPHIVPLIDFWRDPDSAYLVMRWLPGGTLEDRLRERPPTIGETLAIARQVGAALSAAHGHGIVHRDVKPANILFDDAGHAFLTDFGIAWEPFDTTGADVALSPGSPAYAAPEQIRGERLGPEADVFALGAVVGECLRGPSPTSSRARDDASSAVSEVVLRATSVAPGDRFASAGEFVAALADAVAIDSSSPTTGASVVTVSAEAPVNPYVGLRAFDQADADRFFGRAGLVDQLIARLDGSGTTSRGLVLVGPSGSGKSSVVRAGLLPALRSGAVPGSERWFTTAMVPGADPYRSLDTALRRVATTAPHSLLESLRSGPDGIVRGVRACVADEHGSLGDDGPTHSVLLVIDQFEELFTSAEKSDADGFLDALTVAIEEPTSPLRVVATLRADSLHRPLEHVSFAPILRDGAVTVVPLTADELETAITAPARQIGRDFEPGLVARLVAESVGQTSPLPMLQHTLAEMFDRRRSDTEALTVAAYDELGGIAGALAAKADALHESGTHEQRAAIRRVFGRLTSSDQASPDFRRRVAVADLGDDPATTWVLEQFGASRLLTFDRDVTTREPTVEVAHEALLREWPLLAGWLADDAAVLTALDRLSTAADSWVEGGRVESDLARSARLASAADVATAAPDRLRPVDREFVDASVEAAEAEQRDEHRRVRRLRRLVAATAAALVAAQIAGGVALRQRDRADDQARVAEAEADAATDARREADVQADNARTAAIVSSSAALLTEDPELALVLALEANARRPGDTTERAVLDALAHRGLPMASIDLAGLADDDPCSETPMLVSADGRTRFLTTGSSMLSQDLLTGAITDHGPPPEDCVAWLGDLDAGLRWVGLLDGGQWIGPLDGPLRHVDGRDRGGPLTREFAGDHLLFATDGADGPSAVVIDMTTGDRVGSLPPGLVLTDPQSAAVSPDERFFAVGGVSPERPGDPAGDGRLFLLDAETGRVAARIDVPSEVVRVAFDPSSGEVVTLSRQGDVVTVDPSSGEIVARTRTAISGFDRVTVRPDGLIVITSVGQVELIDRRVGRVAAPLPLPGLSTIRPDGTVVNDVGDRIRLIDLDTPPLASSTWSVDPSALVTFGDRRAGVVLPDGTAEVVDLASGEREPVRLLQDDGTLFPAIAILPDTGGLIAFADDGRVTRWVDGRIVDEVSLPSDPSNTRVSRGFQPDLDDGPPGAAFAGVGAMIGYDTRTGQTREYYRLDLGEGRLDTPLVLRNYVGLDVSVAPAPNGGLHVMNASGRLTTFDASGDRVDEVVTGLFDLFAVGRDDANGRLAFGGTHGAVIIEAATSDDDGTTTERVTRLDGIGPVATVGFVDDGDTLVVVEASGTVRLWDMAADRQIGIVWDGLGGASPTPPYEDPDTGSIWVATSGRLVEIPPRDQWVDRACSLIGRSLTSDERSRFLPGDDGSVSACGRE
ncbi:MAG: BTAD domain-containing putative transcriptional regulator [Actinomycetota bacterium]